MIAQELLNHFKTDSPLSDKDSIECPECLKVSLLANWPDTTADCDMCGEHAATQCPECCRVFDWIYDSPIFKVIKAKKENSLVDTIEIYG